MKRLGAIGVLAVVALLATACGQGTTTTTGSGTYKVAILLPGVKNDLSWNQVGFEGLQTAAAQEGIEFAYTDNVGYSADDAARFARLYASKGFNLIIADNSGYKDGIMQVAKEYPNVNFAYQDDQPPGGAGIQLADNVAGYNQDLWQAAYAAGIAAAGVTKKNVVGGVGAQGIPLVYAYYHMFAQGLAKVNPAIKFSAIYTGDWSDSAKAKAAALVLADRGADVLIAFGDGPSRGVAAAAQQTNTYGYGYIHSVDVLAPNNVLGAVIWDSAKSFKMMVDDSRSGHFRPAKHYGFGTKDGLVTLQLNPNLESLISAQAKTMLDQALKDSVSGAFVPVFDPTSI
ncbi:MAG TPA: BMP family protein [Candidatus Dormibacteraeota bacterium]